MAISTRGFGVDAIPGIGLADPNLVASNPNQITQGVLHAYALAGAHYNLQETKAKIASQKKLQDELDALREDRITAKKAQYGADTSGAVRSQATDTAAMPNIAPRANLEGRQIDVLGQTLQPKANAEIATANATTTSAMPIALADVAKANQTVAESAIPAATLANRLKLATTQAAGAANRGVAEETLKDAQLKGSQMIADFTNKITPDQQKLIGDKLAFDLTNAKDNFEVARATKKAQLKLLEEEGAEKHAQGLYYMGLGRQTGRTVDPIASASHLSKIIDTLDKQSVGLPSKIDSSKPMTLSEYEDYMYGDRNVDAKGNPSPNVRGFPLFKSALKPNPQAELLLAEKARALGALKDAYRQSTTTFNAQPQGPVSDEMDDLGMKPSDYTGATPVAPTIPTFKTFDEAKLAFPNGGVKVNIGGTIGTLKPK